MDLLSNLPSSPLPPPTVSDPISDFLRQLASSCLLERPRGTTLRVEVTLESTTGVAIWVLNASDTYQYWRHSTPKT